MRGMMRWLLIALLTTPVVACRTRQHAITGRVMDPQGNPLAGAVVRLRASETETVGDEHGAFTLTGITSRQPVFVTAWTPGYYINGVDGVAVDATDVEIVLQPLHEGDNQAYAWLPATYHAGQGENQGCAECHSREGTDLAHTLPVDEWLLDAHAGSATNARFLTMYAGTDTMGNQSPATRFVSSRDYGRFPLPPDPDRPYFGPGYRLDFPATAGNCAACHAPLAAVDDPLGIDPTRTTGIAREGISCDFCHKIWDIRLDQESGLPHTNMPGVLSYAFRRPPEGHQFFAGPLDDVAPGEDTYVPLQRESAFCAPCHFGVFWDTTIYNSYGEWLESPYSDPVTGKTCQDCHMPPLGATRFARPDRGGVERDPETVFSHRMPGATDAALLRAAVSLTATAARDGDEIRVRVSVINDRTGHHIPTDSPLRQLILLVDVRNDRGVTLQQTAGPTVPEWGGVGEPADGYYAGLPGQAYAKILMELWTQVSPSGAYWNPTRIVSDNRIPALGSDVTEYRFAAPEEGNVSVDVTLLFRRAFIELVDQKGWEVPDIVMAQESIRLDGGN